MTLIKLLDILIPLKCQKDRFEVSFLRGDSRRQPENNELMIVTAGRKEGYSSRMRRIKTVCYHVTLLNLNVTKDHFSHQQ